MKMPDKYVADRQKALSKIRYRERTYGSVTKPYSKVIKDLPAEDVAPVIHSKWRYNDFQDKYVCENCSGGYTYYDETPYCPNCGAKMDGGGENDEG